MKVWLDGKFLPEKKALLPATDPAFLHGQGLFETMRAYRGVPFRLDDHLARMKASADHFKIRFRPRPLGKVVRELCRRNGVQDAAVRLMLSGNGHLLITAQRRPSVPRAWYTRGAEVMVAPWRRDIHSPLVGHKTLNYLENVVTHREARRRGCADALVVGQKRKLLEGCTTNIFLVIGKRLVTPALRQGILPGVTRKVVMEIERAKERTVYLRELWKADEAFLTSSLIEVLPIGTPGPVTREIAAAYKAAVAMETNP